MNTHYIRIVNGEFVSTDVGNTKYETLQNITKEMVKEKLEEKLKTQKKPIPSREFIYSVICELTGLCTKNICSQVLKQEATDPLYQELLHFLLGLEKYQKLIEKTRILRVSESEFLVSDINGVVLKVPNELLDTTQIEELIGNFTSREAELTAKKILTYILTKYFTVSKCYLFFSNEVLQDLIQKIQQTKFFLEYMGSKIEAGFKNGQIFIRLRNDYLPLPSHVTIDALKEEIILYVSENQNTSQKNHIIFESLKRLTGFKVINKVSKYIPTYVGPKKIRKDVLCEDPLYTMLCEFLDTIPQYQENRAKCLEYLEERNQQIREACVLEKELIFIDRNSAYRGLSQSNPAFRQRSFRKTH